MGVRECCRKNCGNIGCDTHINDIGYICYECQREFHTFVKKKGIYPRTDVEIKTALKTFVKTTKGSLSSKTMCISEFFMHHTKEM